MKKINLSITGCLGRMGRQTIRSTKNIKGFKIVSIKDTTPLPHNGTRPPKRRRV